MEGLKKGDSIFKFIPDDIGEIAYCDSTTPKAERDSSIITRIKILFSISIPIAISVLCWLFIDHSPIINTIATLAMAFISSFCIHESLHFYGQDYFVGTRGYAIIKINQSRDNITESTTFHFQDFDDMVSGEKEKWGYSGGHRQYIKTIYHYTVYGREDYNQRKVQAHIYDTYRQNNIKDYYINDDIRFFKMIEEQWTNYKLEMVKEAFNKTASVSFNAYHRDGYINDYITIKGEELIIDGNVYNKDDFNEIYFEDSNLTMVNKNNKGTAFLGLIEKKTW